MTDQKSNKEKKFIGGPYVAVACICENVIQDNIGAMSLIRIIDTFIHRVAAPDPPESMPPHTRRLNMVISIKSGKAIGPGIVEIIPELPNGETKDTIRLQVDFKGEEHGCNLIFTVEFPFEVPGLYLFHVRLDGQEITVIPLRYRYERVFSNRKR